MDLLLLFYILLFLVAFFYASVGHGGASGYLALMTIFGMAPDVMKPTALLLNLFVSACAFFQFYRADYFNRKLFISLALLSIPMAFLGGLIIIDATVYKKILGVLLLLPIARFFFFSGKDITDLKKFNLPAALIIGAAIGFWPTLNKQLPSAHFLFLSIPYPVCPASWCMASSSVRK
jgi:uncharacterized protein